MIIFQLLELDLLNNKSNNVSEEDSEIPNGDVQSIVEYMVDMEHISESDWTVNEGVLEAPVSFAPREDKQVYRIVPVIQRQGERIWA